MVVCLTSARFNMWADILHQGSEGAEFEVTDTAGEWVLQQDPESFEIVRKWQPNPSAPGADPDTPELTSFRCLARGIIDGGIRVAGTTERFSEIYENVDYVRMWLPGNIRISRRDRITNIRDVRGNIIWVEEEEPSSPPTIFNVVGVTPIVDPFGRLIEYQTLLERVQIQ